MEYLDGSDLAQVIVTRGPIAVDTAVDYILQACEAIAEAHAAGIVHRDLKPANLFLTTRKDGSAQVKVLDFGISKMGGREGGFQADVTTSAMVMGSPSYMSPEQMKSTKNVDARTDVWALGVVLWELLAGRPMWDCDNFAGLCNMIVNDRPPSLREVRPEVPAELEGVVMRCLVKNPAHRLQNVAQLATALLPFAPKRSRRSAETIVRIIESAGMSANATAIPPSSEAAPMHSTDAAWGTTHATRRRERPWMVAAGVVALIAVGGSVLYALRSKQPGAPSASTSNALVASVTTGNVEPPKSASAAAAPASAVASSSAASSNRSDPPPVRVGKAAGDGRSGRDTDRPPEATTAPSAAATPSAAVASPPKGMTSVDPFSEQR